MMSKDMSILIFLLAAICTQSDGFDMKIREHIAKDVFDQTVTPLNTKPNSLVVVGVKFDIQHFFFQKNSAFNMFAIMEMNWNDTRLHWNPHDYDNVSIIQVPYNMLWTPDLELYNNAPHKFLRSHRNGKVLLNSAGQLQWSDGIEAEIFCSSDYSEWPRDEQQCELMLGSWTYHGYMVDIESWQKHADLFDSDGNGTKVAGGNVSMLQKNTEYEINNFTIEHVSKFYPCCPEPYTSLKYYMTLKRNFNAYTTVFVIPALCLIMMNLLSLSLDWRNRSQKLTLSGVSLILNALYLIYFANALGAHSRNTPRIVLFYVFSFVLGSLIHLISTVIVAINTNCLEQHLPMTVCKFLQIRAVQYVAAIQPNAQIYKEPPVRFRGNVQQFSTLIPEAHFSGSCQDPIRLQLSLLIKRCSLIFVAAAYLILGSTCLI